MNKSFTINRSLRNAKSELNKLFREMFSLPDPVDLIKILIDIENSNVDEYVQNWYESIKREKDGSG